MSHFIKVVLANNSEQMKVIKPPFFLYRFFHYSFKLKAKAASKGLPYQTLIGSLLHRYSMGESGASLIADADDL
ncbi:hypothetical protein L6252_03480 [Candidatus Parcubacteria bacterium]|nr:hypothetical protein [Candidatus Parcubacteria bacterium]